MRWDELFDDLEARSVEEGRRDLDAEVADRTRRERALLGLQDRFTACQAGDPVSVRVAGAGTVAGRVTGVGADWVLLAERPQHPVLVAFAAIRMITGASARSEQVGAVAKAFGLGSALRAVSRDRAVVEVIDLEGTALTGTIDVVGRDFVDLAEHPSDLPRRPEHVVAIRSVPFAAMAAVRRRS
ncbi:hypothetical protein [Lapillicoccus sp.]|uniref:hypothetical protein n=1 Tax=Lapillicoccus sp. TaxID=1909287 RepID=UPI0025D19414|nr:hypothetical protein [Lapillicoccus sp.]